ncbi:MAG: 30S ribosomal protein S3 [Phycisphaerae bacterium]|jgi:small subunit ribosomal protein S3|nr:30S ribosomal protein S3 [Phycisphaerae bacterium]
MGQKVNPTGFRTGVTIGWKSRWFAPKSNFGEFLVEDERIRKFVDQRLNRQPPYAAVSSVEIDRTREEVKISLRTARPGLVIGPKGAEVEKLKEALEDLTDRRVNINIIEIRNPDLESNLVAEGISEQIKRRASFRRVIKQRADACMQAGAKGVKITVGGRLGGAEIARSETQIRGSIPLHTLEADVDYGFATAVTTYGCIGIKVWIFRGMFGEEEEATDSQQAAMTRARRRYQQRDGGSGGGGGGGGRPPRPQQTAASPPPAAPPEEPKPKDDASADKPKD